MNKGVIAIVLALAMVASGLVENAQRVSFSVTPKQKVFERYTATTTVADAAAVTDAESLAAAEAHLATRFPGYEFVRSSAYLTKHNGVFHAYWHQAVNGLRVLNGWVNANVRAGQVVSIGSFATAARTSVVEPQISALEAVKALAVRLDRALPRDAAVVGKTVVRSGLSLDGDFDATLAYFQNEDGDALTLVWQMVVRTEEDWFDVAVSAMDGQILSMVNWVKDDSYEVYKPPVNDPEDGEREVTSTSGHTSELGWHDQGSGVDTTTVGNNCYAQENVDGSSSWENNYRPDGTSNLVFEYPVDLTQQPDTYVDASITNLFYMTNVIHDVWYGMGFDEASGNFQENNLGRGGADTDAVQVNAQDGAGYNNANFATPTDGNRPRMRMYLWNGFNPMRDGDFENSIIVHEYAHGLSNRLTGGPNDVSCLPSGQPGGMGEGWGDFYGVAFMAKASHTRQTVYPMGAYVTQGGTGIRHFPYAADGVNGTNPQTFDYINNNNCRGSVHCIGSVWCQILWDVYWQLVDKSGFDGDLYNGNAGNNQILVDVMDGMKIQPCRPNFCNARDAILQADELNGFGNYCELWTGFAGRGLGVNADCVSNTVGEDFSVPPECL